MPGFGHGTLITSHHGNGIIMTLTGIGIIIISHHRIGIIIGSIPGNIISIGFPSPGYGTIIGSLSGRGIIIGLPGFGHGISISLHGIGILK